MILLLSASIAACSVPAAAYRVVEQAHISRADRLALERYALCICGPEGVNDAPFVPDPRGRYVYDPKWACERYGWDDRRKRYVKAKP